MKYKLDCSKWICGNPSTNQPADGIRSLGEGNTALLNDGGYMCCLGQFSEQHGIIKKRLLCCGEPKEVNMLIDGLTEVEGPYLNGTLCYKNTDLSIIAMEINDEGGITIAEKIVRLRELFEENGHEIELVNFPDHILEEVIKKEAEK